MYPSTLLTICLLLVVSPSAVCLAQETPDAQPPPTSEPAPPATNLKGPMRVELVALTEQRYAFFEEAPERPVKQQLRIQMRLLGERLPDVVRLGSVVFEQLTDDAGKSLLPEYTAEEIGSTKPVTLNRSKAQFGLSATVEPSSRAARTLQVAKGKLRLVYSSNLEEVTLLRPLRYRGGTISSQRLQEAGIEIAMLASDVVPPTDNKPEAAVTLQFVKNEEKVRSVDFYDDWMQKMLVRSIAGKTPAGEPCVTYSLATGEITDDTQIVISFYPTVEIAEIPVDLSGKPLP